MRQEGGEKKTCEGEERESPEREGGREWGEGKRKPERGYLCGRALARLRDVGACLQFGVPRAQDVCCGERGWVVEEGRGRRESGTGHGCQQTHDTHCDSESATFTHSCVWVECLFPRHWGTVAVCIGCFSHSVTRLSPGGPRAKMIKNYATVNTMCFFVLCNRHWCNRGPGSSLGIACLSTLHPDSDAGCAYP